MLAGFWRMGWDNAYRPGGCLAPGFLSHTLPMISYASPPSSSFRPHWVEDLICPCDWIENDSPWSSRQLQHLGWSHRAQRVTWSAKRVRLSLQHSQHHHHDSIAKDWSKSNSWEDTGWYSGAKNSKLWKVWWVKARSLRDSGCRDVSMEIRLCERKKKKHQKQKRRIMYTSLSSGEYQGRLDSRLTEVPF